MQCHLAFYSLIELLCAAPITCFVLVLPSGLTPKDVCNLLRISTSVMILPHKSYPRVSSIMLCLLAKALGVVDVEDAMAMYNSCIGRTVLTMECVGIEAHETLVTAAINALAILTARFVGEQSTQQPAVRVIDNGIDFASSLSSIVFKSLRKY